MTSSPRFPAESAYGSIKAAPRDPKAPTFDTQTHDVRHPFDTAVVSAFMEIFNNIAIHAYQRKGGGRIEISIALSKDSIVIDVKDDGRPFDIDGVAELPAELDDDSLPEGGMGIHIAKTMLDEMIYEPGPPNLWRLCKRLHAPQLAVGRS